jgi:hypothetical protein
MERNKPSVGVRRRMQQLLPILAVMALAAALPAGKAQARVIMVHMSPYCGCCGNWVEHLQRSGFTIEKRMVDDLATVRTRYGVPADFASCHTAVVGDYVVEGHVPAADIRRLLEERPLARGLAVPGMPSSAPGMESAGDEPYMVLLFDQPGTAQVFARH